MSPNSLQNRDLIWLVSFMDYDLGYVDLEEKTLRARNQDNCGPADIETKEGSSEFTVSASFVVSVA